MLSTLFDNSRLLFMLSTLFDNSRQFCRQHLALGGSALHFRCSRRRWFTLEYLRANFHLSVANRRKHADWEIAISVQPTQKSSLRLETKQCFSVVYRINRSFCALIVGANLN